MREARPLAKLPSAMAPSVALVYQAYGGRAYLDQALFSILTFRHHYPATAPNIQLVVYTDQPEHFAGSGAQCELLTPERIAAWRGRYGFVHRLKVEMLRDATNRFSASLLYLDSDTYWKSSPLELLDAIQTNHCVMDRFEGNLSSQCHPYLHEYLLREKKQGRGAIAPQSPMWCAGVVGLPFTHRTLLDEVLTLTDALYRRIYQKDWLEQFAFSATLAEHSVLMSSTRQIEHYWKCSGGAAALIGEFLDANRDADRTELPALAAAFTTDLESYSRARPENAKPPALKKLRRSLLKRWTHLRVMVDNVTGRG